ncbi:O-antigen ligase family protein [Novosphingobium resinovorum]|uniref:O-antigen ligase family protein n=1 Tax=Novosphingobium resinovorum TaxID=158500 RepID=UPI003D2BF81D
MKDSIGSSWLPVIGVAKSLSVLSIVATAILFLGIYTAIDVVLPSGGTLPMISAAPGVLLMFLQPRFFSKRLIQFITIPIGVVALFCLLSPSLSTMLINRLNSLAQIGYGLLISFSASWALLRIGRERLWGVLSIVIPIYLCLLSFEVLSPAMQGIVRGYQEVVYPTNQDVGMLINREMGMGGYRPKFFTSETSFVAMSLFVIITGYIWSGRTLVRYLLAVGYTFAGFLIVRSPIIIFLIPVIFITAITDPIYRKYRTVIGVMVGIVLVCATSIIMLTRGDIVNARLQNATSGQDFSTTFRTYGSMAVAVEVLKKYPLFGVGPGGLDLAKKEIISTELRLGVPPEAVEKDWRISIANAPSYLAISFGLAGFIIGNFIIYRFVSSSVQSPILPVITAILVWGMAYGAVYTPKFLVTLIVIVTLGQLRNGQIKRNCHAPYAQIKSRHSPRFNSRARTI